MEFGAVTMTGGHGTLGRGHLDEEAAVVADPECGVGAHQDGRGERLDQGGTLDLVPRAKRGRVVDGRLLPAMGAMPRRADLDRRRRRPTLFANRYRYVTRRTAGAEADRGQQDGPAMLNVAVETLVFGLESPASGVRLHDPIRHRHPDCPELTRVVEFQRVLKPDLVRPESLAAQNRQRLGTQVGEGAVDIRWRKAVDRTGHEAHEVLADVRMQHADRTQRTGVPRHVDAATAQAPRNRRAMHRPGTARRDEGKAARRVSPFDGHVLDGVQHMLLDHVDDAGSGLFHGQPQRTRNLRSDRLACRFDVQIEDAAGRLPGAQAAEHQLGVRDRGPRAAASIAGRTGIGASTFRPHEEHPGVIDPGDRPAASADGVDVDGGRRDVVPRDHDVVARCDRTARHQQHVARRAPDLHRYQVARIRRFRGRVDGFTVQVQCTDRGSRPAEQQADWALGNLVHRGSTAVRLQQQDRPLEAARREFAVERTQVRNDDRQECRIDHGCRRSLVLAHERRHRCGGGGPLAGPALGKRTRHRAFMCVVQKTVHQAHGDGFDPFGLEVRHDVVKPGEIERRDLGSIGVDPAGNGLAQVARDENRRVGKSMVELVLAQPPADLERVPEPLRCDEADRRALGLEHGVGRNGGAMHEQGTRFEKLTYRSIQVGGEPLQRRDDAAAGVNWDRGDLGDPRRAVGIGEHEVGERAADVYADPPGWGWSASFHGARQRYVGLGTMPTGSKRVAQSSRSFNVCPMPRNSHSRLVRNALTVA